MNKRLNVETGERIQQVLDSAWQDIHHRLFVSFSKFGPYFMLGRSAIDDKTTVRTIYRLENRMGPQVVPIHHFVTRHDRGYHTASMFLPDGRIALGEYDGTIRVMDLRSKEFVLVLEKGHETSPIVVMDLSEDGRQLATGSQNGSICLWQLGEGAAHCKVSGLGSSVSGLSFNPQGSQLIIRGSQEGQVGPEYHSKEFFLSYPGAHR